MIYYLETIIKLLEVIIRVVEDGFWWHRGGLIGAHVCVAVGLA